jgi:hypothetical protein
MELVHRPEARDAGIAVLRHAIAELRRARCDAALAWCFDHSPGFRTYLRGGFLPFPERLRPVTLHFGVRPFDEDLRSVLLDRKSWYLSYCDSDTV